MAVTMADISKLRAMTGAGLMDCKKALAEANNDMNAAIEIIRKKGQAVAAKREDREASEGCVLADAAEGFAAIVALKCETYFVAKNEGFVALTKKILAAAMAAKAKNIDELKDVEIEGRKISDLIVEEIGKTGEKMELGAYEFVEGVQATAYNHFGNKLSTIVAFNEKLADAHVGKEVAMQVAAMNPIALDEDSMPQEVKDSEYNVAVDKTRQEQIQKAVEVAIKKAGFNPAHFDSEAHMESNQTKGWITADDVVAVKKIIADVTAEKSANLNETMIQNIAKGRLNKFFKENCLLKQEFVSDNTMDIATYLKKQSATLTVTAFKRVNLNKD